MRKAVETAVGMTAGPSEGLAEGPGNVLRQRHGKIGATAVLERQQPAPHGVVAVVTGRMDRSKPRRSSSAGSAEHSVREARGEYRCTAAAATPRQRRAERVLLAGSPHHVPRRVPPRTTRQRDTAQPATDWPDAVRPLPRERGEGRREPGLGLLWIDGRHGTCETARSRRRLRPFCDCRPTAARQSPRQIPSSAASRSKSSGSVLPAPKDAAARASRLPGSPELALFCGSPVSRRRRTT